MKRISGITLGLLLSALVPRDADAQWNVARFGAEPNRVYYTAGLDPAMISTLGYARIVPVSGHDFMLTSEVGFVAASMDTRDFRARLGAQTSLLRWRSVHMTGSASFIARGTENSIYKGFNWGADVTGGIGVYRPRWFAGGEFGLDKAIITHVTHSEWYRTHFYPDAKDGWYLDAGGTHHFGVVSGFALGKAEVVGRFGLLRTEHNNDMMPPIYGSMGVGFRF